ncbi:hypothetical protein, partial [Gordonia sp. ABSL49_1]|uniref:hypothetical protein n=1 Tax=Gordonia sp. ABSL49_1 TaxID=2920941 RepID=UPI001F10A0F4
MNTNALPGDIANLVEQTTALGGTIPAELAAITDTMAAVADWTPPEATDIASIVRRGDLDADNAAAILDDALVQPNRNPADLKVTAKHELTQQFARTLQGKAGDQLIESIRPTFTTACTAIAKAAELVPAGATPADLAEADDQFIQAWRTLGEHRTTLDQVAAIIDILIMRFDVLGGPQPWHGPRWIDAAFHVTDVSWLERCGRALTAPNGAGGARGGKWHSISSALTLNTVTDARAILADA